MDKRFEDLRDIIDRQNNHFWLYLKCFVFDEIAWDILEEVSKQTKLYVFSGVIRNFLLGIECNRDIDFVVEDLKNVHIPFKYLMYIRYIKNSFGGYKICISGMTIDIWDIKESWSMLVNPKLRPTPYTLIRTPFFNFSAIVYDVRRRKFIYDTDFLIFYHTKVMNVVNEINPNPALCIVSTMHYAKKYVLGIHSNLLRWILNHSYPNLDYELAQMRHFHTIEFSNKEILEFIEECRLFCK